MFDLIGTIKEKSGIGDISELLTVPKSVQDVFDIKTVYPDGVFHTGKDKYSKTFKFTDINYAVSGKKDKETSFFKYSDILNSLENDVSTQIRAILLHINSIKKKILVQNDGTFTDRFCTLNESVLT